MRADPDDEKPRNEDGKPANLLDCCPHSKITHYLDKEEHCAICGKSQYKQEVMQCAESCAEISPCICMSCYLEVMSLMLSIKFIMWLSGRKKRKLECILASIH